MITTSLKQYSCTLEFDIKGQVQVG